MNNSNNVGTTSTPNRVTSGDTTARPDARDPRRNQVLYVRVTPAEKEFIVERAIQARLSVSRYLTRLALEGKSPLPADERKRLEDLIALFKQTERGLRYLWVQANEQKLFSTMPGVEEDFSLATQTLSGLIQELTKRL
jgi:hypothetical protein